MRNVLAILCLTALVTAGCGDDDDDEATPAVETTPPAETQPAPAPPEEPEATVPEEDPPPEHGDGSGGAEAPHGDEDAGDGAVAAPSDCGRVAFRHGTDSGASEIQAVGVDCESARALARTAGDHGDDLEYESRGFECHGQRTDEPPLPMIDWVCMRNPAEQVKFSSS